MEMSEIKRNETIIAYFNDIKVCKVLSVSYNWYHEWPGGFKLEIIIEIEWPKELDDLLLILDESMRKEVEDIWLKLLKDEGEEAYYLCQVTSYSEQRHLEIQKKLVVELLASSA